MNEESPLLGGKLSGLAIQGFGSRERAQIGGMIALAPKLVLDAAAAGAVRDLVDGHCWSVEANLDLAAMPGADLWIEWRLPERFGPAARRTGCLLAPHPELAGTILGVTAWEEGGHVSHSYGVALLSVDSLESVARTARGIGARDREVSLTRMMDGIHAFIPDGFESEIALLAEGGVADAREAALRDATLEMPFVLAVLVAMASVGGLVVEEGEYGHVGRLGDAVGRRNTIGGFLRRRRLDSGDGIVRTGRRTAAWNRSVA